MFEISMCLAFQGKKRTRMGNLGRRRGRERKERTYGKEKKEQPEKRIL